MSLLDDILGYGADWASAGVRISEDSLLYEPKLGVPAWVGLEYMAQTTALFSGLRAQNTDQPIKLGLLLGARRFNVQSSYFRLGQYLEIRSRCEWDNGAYGAFDCEISRRGEPENPLATARIQVYLVENQRAFFEDIN